MTQPASTPPKGPERAAVFVDGNNFYNGLDDVGVTAQGQLSFAKIAMKLVGPRTWTALRYYVGQVQNNGNPKLYADQRSFISRQQNLDRRITFHFGRIEPRVSKNAASDELFDYLVRRKAAIERVDQVVYNELGALARSHQKVTLMVEKAVDVMLAVDLVVMAERNEFDTVYILSADGDYTHAVKFARDKGKKVFAVSARNGHELATAVGTGRFLKIDKDWVKDCYI